MPYRPGTCEAKSQTGQIEAKRGWPAGAPATIAPGLGGGSGEAKVNWRMVVPLLLSLSLFNAADCGQ